MSGQACLVTGATGFIGGRLARRLLREGHTVRALARASSDTSALEQLDLEIELGDLTSRPSLARAVAGCDVVFHCGALVSDWATAEEIAAVNVGGTRNLLEASLAASVRRIVHFSSTDVYGYPGGAGVEETFRARRFRNWYAQTKLAAEAEIDRAQRDERLEAVVLRPATVYGPGSADVIGEIARAIRGGHMVLIAGGRAVAGLCYVENLIDAAILALRHDGAPGQAFNVTDGLAVSWRELADGLADGLGSARVRWSLPYPLAYSLGFLLEHGYRLLRRAGGSETAPLLSRQAVQVLGRNQDFSNRKLREVLGWEPRVDYATGLQETVAWLKSQQLVS
ncbi:MAG TPA: NAD-dependent epimerase/dehydratase family protein [Solirubrobacteraceae bacterium]